MPLELASVHRAIYPVYRYEMVYQEQQTQEVALCKLPLPEHHAGTRYEQSNCLRVHPLDTAIDRTKHIVATLTTGLKVSS